MSHTYAHLLTRKGASRTADIPDEVLEALNLGAISTVNLTEWLMVDNVKLLNAVFQEKKFVSLIQTVAVRVAELKKPTVNSIQQTIGITLRTASAKNRDEVYSFIATHTSDSVRCWAAYFVGTDPDLSLDEKLIQLEPLAADHHFGVREVAWLAVRPSLAAELEKALQLLTPWVSHSDANIRRFASESLRPRGVWCAHITPLKEQPELALHLLEPLRSDSSEYVRNSVANWLNDAAKTQPTWVQQVCKRWSKESPTKETQLIVKRALRSL